MTDSFGAAGRTTYVYDDNYRLATLTRKVGSNEELTVKNGYDDAGRLTSRARTVSTASKVLHRYWGMGAVVPRARPS
jgi:YD repeat-containing protein